MLLIIITWLKETFAAIFKWTSSDSLILAVIADAATVLVFLFVGKTLKIMPELVKVLKNLFKARKKSRSMDRQINGSIGGKE